MASRFKRIMRRAARPLISPLDGRVSDINRRVAHAREAVEELGASTGEQIERLTRELSAYATTAAEASAYLGVEMRRINDSVDELKADLDDRFADLRSAVAAQAEATAERMYVERLDRAANAPLESLDGAVANLVNSANSHRGFAAGAGLWFNPPVTVELTEGNARLAGVNERIVEVPFALGQLLQIDVGARILDIGGAESTFSLSAASLGYQVTAVDPQGVPFEHPNLRVVARLLEDWDGDPEPFAAAFLISAIEHFGLGAYGEPRSGRHADRDALGIVRELLEPDGRLVLTTPWARQASTSDFERVYDDGALAELLDGWEIIERRVIEQVDATTWRPGDDAVRQTALIVARPERQT
jgi:hypothetical protein